MLLCTSSSIFNTLFVAININNSVNDNICQHQQVTYLLWMNSYQPLWLISYPFFKLLLLYTRYFALNIKIQKVEFFKNHPCISDTTLDTKNDPFTPLFLGSSAWLLTKKYAILSHKLSWAFTKLCKLGQVENFAQGRVWKTRGCFDLTFCIGSLESYLVC